MTKKRAFLAIAALLVFAVAAGLLSRDNRPPSAPRAEDVYEDGSACTIQEPMAVCPVQ
jgi:hypothetical protein